MLAGRCADMGKLLIGAAVLVHVTVFHHGVVADQGKPPRVFHIVDKRRWPLTGRTGCANGPPVGMSRGAVANHCHIALACRDHGAGVVGLKFKRRPAHVSRIDNTGLETKIFRNAQTADVLIAAGVVHGVHITPL